MEDFFAAMVFLVTFGSFTLLGIRMILKYRLERLKGSEVGGEAVQRLEEAVSGLRDEVYLLRNDLVDVQERVEFTERLIARGGQQDRLPGA